MRPYDKRSQDFLALSKNEQISFIIKLRLSREETQREQKEKIKRKPGGLTREKKPIDPLKEMKKLLLKEMLEDKETIKKANVLGIKRGLHKVKDIE